MEITVKVPAEVERVDMFGAGERNLKMIREALGVAVAARGGVVHVKGDREAVVIARLVLGRLAAAAQEDRGLSRQQVLDLIAEEASRGATAGNARNASAARALAEADTSLEPIVPIAEAWDGRLDVYASGRPVRPRTPNQDRYLQAIRDHDLVFGIGPAGTGKTYLAVAAAVHLLKRALANKVILVRPAVEAGEKLGFLPGDMQAKVNPYLRPLLDALHDMMDFPTIRRFMDNDVIEVVPLAFMRGRTLNNAIVILDEAQNTTRGQMQMFLTRLGHGSKMIVTGDATQIDLPDARESGLIDAARRLSRTRGVAFVHLDKADVVRHPLVQRVIDAYDDTPERRLKLDAATGADAAEPPEA
ncbi:MAG: PhoH family protein [Planctomycetota bacterium]|nr:PhoH family protein [Planctomycetota bacterium]